MAVEMPPTAYLASTRCCLTSVAYSQQVNCKKVDKRMKV
jgi:hypothetical protein